MRVLAIDFGRKRIGLAISDESGIAISNLPQMQFNSQGFWPELSKLIESEKPAKVLIGKSSLHENEATSIEQETENFAKHLQKLFAELTIEFVDESYTSVLAEQMLNEMIPKKSKKSQKKKKAQLDSMAAHIMLRQYLDH